MATRGDNDVPTEVERGSGDGWSRSGGQRSVEFRRVIVWALITAVLSSGAWFGAGAWFQADGLQKVADRWAEFHRCFLGEGLAPGELPSARLDAIRSILSASPDGAEWPERCMTYARELDDASSARSVREVLGNLPSALALMSVRQPGVQKRMADQLWRGLREIELPLARPRVQVLAAPLPGRPLLKTKGLSPFVTVTDLDDLAIDFDPVTGRRVRILVREPEPMLCQLSTDAEGRWRRARCRPVLIPMLNPVDVRMTRAEPGAAALLYVRNAAGRDGLFDASSGQRIWRPNFGQTRAMVRRKGDTTILYAESRVQGGRRHIERHRVVQFRPGRAPANRKLRFAGPTQTLLLPQLLLWWHAKRDETGSRDVLWGRRLLEAKRWLGAAQVVGALPIGSRHVADCVTDDRTVVLLATTGAEPRHTLLWIDGYKMQSPVDVGVLKGNIELSCDQDAAVITRREGARYALWRCDSDRCEHAVTEDLPGLENGNGAIAPLGDRLALVWAEPGSPIRMRIGLPEELHHAPDEVLLDEPEVVPTDWRLLASRGAALLLLQGAADDLYALHVDGDGRVTGVKPRL